MGILMVLQQVTSPSFEMTCSNSQLTGAHPFQCLFTFFCHRHQMEWFLFWDLRIFSLSLPLCAWFSSTPFLSFVSIYIYILIALVYDRIKTVAQCHIHMPYIRLLQPRYTYVPSAGNSSSFPWLYLIVMFTKHL